MSDVQVTADELLNMIGKQVEKDYKAKIVDKWIEQDNETKQLSAVFELYGKIGCVKVSVEAEIEER